MDNLTSGSEWRARGDWNQIKGKMRQEWADLTDDDLDYQEGQHEQWLGRMQEKTGHAIADIKGWFARNFG